jgi:hypothetical protein
MVNLKTQFYFLLFIFFYEIAIYLILLLIYLAFIIYFINSLIISKILTKTCEFDIIKHNNSDNHMLKTLSETDKQIIVYSIKGVIKKFYN